MCNVVIAMVTVMVYGGAGNCAMYALIAELVAADAVPEAWESLFRNGGVRLHDVQQQLRRMLYNAGRDAVVCRKDAGLKVDKQVHLVRSLCVGCC